MKLSDRNFKAVNIKLLHKVITNSLETDEKIENLGKEIKVMEKNLMEIF